MLFSLIRTPAEPTRSGSLTGSQGPQPPSDARPQPAHIRAVRWLIERHRATHRDGSTVPSKQRVAGSNPAGRTHMCSDLGKLVSLGRRPSCFGQATRRYRRYFGAWYLCSAPHVGGSFSMSRPVSSTLKTASKPALKNPLRASAMPLLAPSAVSYGPESAGRAAAFGRLVAFRRRGCLRRLADGSRRPRAASAP
jgi:hypothetical protein